MNNKYLYILWSLLISSCNMPSPLPQIDPAVSTEEARNQLIATHAAEAKTAFEYNESCPNVCWLGIQSGSTTVEEAIDILRSSERISKEFFHVSDDEIQVDYWYIDGKFKSSVFLTISDGFVESITFTKASALRVNDINELLGEPDAIDIGFHDSLHCEGLSVHYYLRYFEQQVSVYIGQSFENGPKSTDWIDAIWLGEQKTFNNSQPWLGYGKPEEYLSGQGWPTLGPCYPSGP